MGSNRTVGKRGRHAQISNKARTVDRVDQTRMTQGRAKKEKPMTEEAVCIGVDVVGSAEFIVKEVLYFFVGRGFISKMPVA